MIIETLIFAFFSVSVFYLLVLSIGGKIVTPNPVPKSSLVNRICYLVPCYKEDGIIIHVVEQLLKRINYPKDSFQIVIIADSFKKETLTQLAQYPIKVIDAKLEQSSKANSVNYALQRIEEPFDIVLVSDADNVPEPNFLYKINDAFNAGHKVIQAQRVAKNSNTSYAVLDGISEIINNHLFRKGANAVGLSASIIGSGLAVDFNLYKEQMARIFTVDEDRPLQLNLFELGYKIKYLEGALIFDEKVSNAEAFKKQRGRWISSQLFYTKMYFAKGWKMLAKGNFDYFNLAVIHNVVPPRSLMIFFLLFFALLFSVIPSTLTFFWWALFGVFIFTLLLALPAKIFTKQFFLAVLYLPQAIFKIIQSVFQRKKNQGENNIHTEHTHVEVENHLYSD
jgi:cellulose synthase/poly-beta-1,6-N-acetylglucosamine synthase-like glycosyltransferase